MTLTTWDAMQRRIPTGTQLLGSLDRTDLLSTIFGCKFSHETLLAWMKPGPWHCSVSSSVRKPSATAKKDLSEISEDWRDPQIHMSRCVFEVGRRGGMEATRTRQSWKEPGIRGTLWLDQCEGNVSHRPVVASLVTENPVWT